ERGVAVVSLRRMLHMRDHGAAEESSCVMGIASGPRFVVRESGELLTDLDVRSDGDRGCGGGALCLRGCTGEDREGGGGDEPGHLHMRYLLLVVVCSTRSTSYPRRETARSARNAAPFEP